MSEQEFIERLKKDSQEFLNFYEGDLPEIILNEAVSFYKESFQNEGFTDEVLEPWQEVKRRENPRRPDRAAASRPILTGSTGDLGRSIEGAKGNDEVRITADTAGVGSSKSYAAAHNEGTDNAGRNRNVRIPKRQFIGESATLNKILKEKIERRIKLILKS